MPSHPVMRSFALRPHCTSGLVTTTGWVGHVILRAFSAAIALLSHDLNLEAKRESWKGPGRGGESHQAEVMFAMTWAYVTLFLGLSSSCKATAETVSVSHNCPLVCTFSYFFLRKAGNQTLWKFLTDWQLWRVGFCICVTSELSWKSSLGGMFQWHGRWACTFVISNLYIAMSDRRNFMFVFSFFLFGFSRQDFFV